MKLLRKSLTICMLLFAGTAQGMAPRQNRNYNDCIRLNPLPEIGYHTGEDVRFYGEYRPRQLSPELVEFPLNACDQVPIYTFGNIWYFFTSAIEGHAANHMGQALIIEDPSITDVIVVRGKNDINGYRVEAYLGCNSNLFSCNGRKRIYTPIVLALAVKDTYHVENVHFAYFNGTGNFDNMKISHEIRKYIKGGPFDEKNPVFQEVILELLGEGWVKFKNAAKIYKEPIYTCGQDYSLSNGRFYSTEAYWTKDENRLKGIIYRNNR